MLKSVARKIFGSANDRLVKKYSKIVDQINNLEPEFIKLSDDDLRQKTIEYKNRFNDGETLDDLLPEAFASVREAAKRTLGQRHYDVQLVGGIVLHNGMISEMKTGEGKTLVATLAAYLNALNGKGVHVVTVNDYLAQRDAEWMGQVYRFLGLTTDYITHEKDEEGRKAAYNSDIVYVTNNELGFDYLRDNMKFHREEMVQRDFNYAIIDEVDSILIDEARTPLIISGALDDSSEKYVAIDKVIPELNDADYEKDEKAKNITLTETGTEHVEQILKDKGIIKEGNLYDLSNISLVHHVNQALRAHKMQVSDVDYIVKNDQVMIIDEFTGRIMEGRRYSDGLHQAIEAKENVTIQSENQTLASITFQNYFRAYPKLSGMTGTAMTEEAEFADIYGLSAIEIPTNKPIARNDHNDEIYRTEEEKYDAILEVIQDCYDRKQPILVGTTSIEKSELLANLLKKRTKIKFEVLNAKHHEREASIVSQAGVPGSVTIATNMAGRGTDIQLGGNLDMRLKEVLKGDESPEDVKKITEKLEAEVKANKEVALKAGGLYVLATERHESRRIDNQLRGRSGRQGDPGDSKFFLSLQDDLMRIFGSEKMDTMLQRLGLPKGEPIVHPFISKALEKAQEKVEERNYDLRKNLLKYDDVMNEQRKVIYEQRKAIMETDDVSDTIVEMREELLSELINTYVPYKSVEADWDVMGLKQEINKITGLNLPINQWASMEGVGSVEISEKIIEEVEKFVNEKNGKLPDELLRMVEKSILLQMLDQLWKDHIATLDHMRHTILLRAYGQKDPLNEYKKESFNLFSYMLDQLRERVTTLICRSEVQAGDLETLAEQEEQASKISNIQASHASADEKEENKQTTFSYNKSDVVDPSNPATWGKVKRNDPCPCGSGKKYKNCHGA